MSLQSFLRKIPGIGRLTGFTREKSQGKDSLISDQDREDHTGDAENTTMTNEEIPLQKASNETNEIETDEGETKNEDDPVHEKHQPGTARAGPEVKSGMRNFNIRFNMEKCEPDEKDKDRKGSGYKKLK